MKVKTILSGVATLILILPGVIGMELYSQGTDSRRIFGNKDKIYLGINISPLQSVISNEGFADSIYKRGISASFGFEAGYFFSKIAGVTMGIEFSPYSSQLSRASYSASYDTVDNEAESYQMQITGRNITEDQRISFLTIPVCMSLRFGGEKRRFYINGGVSFNIPVKKTYESTGIFTYDGYYPAYPVTLKNLPSYGFPSDLDMSVSGGLKIKSMIPAISMSGGAIFNLGGSIQLAFGFYYNRSFADISGYKTDPDFRLTSRAGQMKSFMAGSTEAIFEGFGARLGLRFYLK